MSDDNEDTSLNPRYNTSRFFPSDSELFSIVVNPTFSKFSTINFLNLSNIDVGINLIVELIAHSTKTSLSFLLIKCFPPIDNFPLFLVTFAPLNSHA